MWKCCWCVCTTVQLVVQMWKCANQAEITIKCEQTTTQVEITSEMCSNLHSAHCHSDNNTISQEKNRIGKYTQWINVILCWLKQYLCSSLKPFFLWERPPAALPKWFKHKKNETFSAAEAILYFLLKVGGIEYRLVGSEDTSAFGCKDPCVYIDPQGTR